MINPIFSNKLRVSTVKIDLYVLILSRLELTDQIERREFRGAHFAPWPRLHGLICTAEIGSRFNLNVPHERFLN